MAMKNEYTSTSDWLNELYSGLVFPNENQAFSSLLIALKKEQTNTSDWLHELCGSLVLVNENSALFFHPSQLQ